MSSSESSPEEIERRNQWFEAYYGNLDHRSVVRHDQTTQSAADRLRAMER